VEYGASMVQKTETVNDESAAKCTNIGDRLREERTRLGYSQIAFAALGGASKGSQLAWEKGAAYPNAEFLQFVAHFGVDVLYVVTGRRGEADLSVEEAAVLGGYRKLDERGRVGVLALISGLQPDANPRVRVKGDIGQVVHGDVRSPVTIDMSKKKRG